LSALLAEQPSHISAALSGMTLSLAPAPGGSPFIGSPPLDGLVPKCSYRRNTISLAAGQSGCALFPAPVQERHPFVRLVSFQTTVKLVSLKWTNSPFFQWLKHVHFPSGAFHFAVTVVSYHSTMPPLREAVPVRLKASLVSISQTRPAVSGLRQCEKALRAVPSHSSGSQTCTKARLARSPFCLKQTNICHVSVVSGYPRRTVVRRGSSVFCCQAKVPKSNASEWSRWSAESVFAGIFRHDAHPNKIRERNTPFGQQPVDSPTCSVTQKLKIGRKPVAGLQV